MLPNQSEPRNFHSMWLFAERALTKNELCPFEHEMAALQKLQQWTYRQQSTGECSVYIISINKQYKTVVYLGLAIELPTALLPSRPAYMSLNNMFKKHTR